MAVIASTGFNDEAWLTPYHWRWENDTFLIYQWTHGGGMSLPLHRLFHAGTRLGDISLPGNHKQPSCMSWCHHMHDGCLTWLPGREMSPSLVPAWKRRVKAATSLHHEFIGRRRKDELKPLVWVCASCFLKWFDAICCVTGKTSGP